MKAVETVLHLRRERPRLMRHMIPSHVWALVKPYGLASRPGESPDADVRPRLRP
jgi:coenzyme F420 hydrogenase subunit beta